MIGDRERSALRFVWSQAARTGALRQVADRTRKPQQVALVGVANDWHNQAFVERNRDAQMNASVQHDALLGKATIHDGNFLQSHNRRLSEKSRIGQPHVLARKLVFALLTLRDDAA